MFPFPSEYSVIAIIVFGVKYFNGYLRLIWINATFTRFIAICTITRVKRSFNCVKLPFTKSINLVSVEI